MFKITTLALIGAVVTMLSIASCKKSEQTVTPAPPSNEFLTTVILQCVNTNAPYDTVTTLWRDLTPNGSNPPDTSRAQNFRLHKNTTYSCMVYILDESQTPVNQLADTAHFNINKISSSTNNVTTEIRARQNYHLICWTMTPAALASNLSVVRTDYDGNTPPLQVGLDDNITTLSPSAGRTEVVLHHQPNVKNGSCEPGSIDFDVTYGTTIY